MKKGDDNFIKSHAIYYEYVFRYIYKTLYIYKYHAFTKFLRKLSKKGYV